MPRNPRLCVGDRVRYFVGNTPHSATVLEDRGDLAADGGQIVRLRHLNDGIEFEVPAKRVVLMPDAIKKFDDFVSVDPGVHKCGVAIWRYAELYWAGMLPTVGEWTKFAAIVDYDYDLVVVEKPILRPDRKARAADIISLAAAAGYMAGRLTAFTGNVEYFTPSGWKGSVKKDIHWDRTSKVLSPDEIKAIAFPKDKKGKTDVQDAISLGLTYSGRYRRPVH